MSFRFSDKDFKRIGKVLGVRPSPLGSVVRFEVLKHTSGRSLAVEIYSDIEIGKRKGSLVSVHTSTAHLQLHFCTGFVASDLLGEVTFVGESAGKVSGLTVEREGGCSLYANVDRKLLSGDFTRLGPEVMLSGIALSLTESVLPDEAMTEQEFEETVLKGRSKVRASRKKRPVSRK
jgi:hypothetical protein